MDELCIKLLEIKDQMAGAGVAMTDNGFSVILAKSRRYVSWLRATGHAPAIDALVSLYVWLDDLVDTHEAAGNTVMAKQIDSVAASLWGVIRKSVRTTAPHRRKRQTTTLVDEPRAGG